MDTFDVTTEGSNYTVSVMGFEAASPMEVICELYGTSVYRTKLCLCTIIFLKLYCDVVLPNVHTVARG